MDAVREAPRSVAARGRVEGRLPARDEPSDLSLAGPREMAGWPAVARSGVDWSRVGGDYVTLVMVGLFAALLIGILLLGRFAPGSGAQQLDWRPTRSADADAQAELDDIDQMLGAANARRRARGEPERTEEQLRAELAADEGALRARREAHLADVDLDQLLEAKNARRRARGLPELNIEQFRAQLQAGEAPRRPRS